MIVHKSSKLTSRQLDSAVVYCFYHMYNKMKQQLVRHRSEPRYVTLHDYDDSLKLVGLETSDLTKVAILW